LDPTAILCIGLNYRDHAHETGRTLPERPVLFMKNPAAAWHPDADIELPRRFVERPEVDYEVELAVVIGRAARNVKAAEALDHVYGYTIANDVSARRVQKHGGGGQWVRGKSYDTFCPMGPVLVTADEIPDPQALGLRTRLDGELMQDSSTAEMIFGVAELIADLSTNTTLLPGTVILTGTPAGVGFVRQPRRFLVPGDRLELEIDGIGSLCNGVREAPQGRKFPIS
jgi:2-keto-4-pentenoate hydratase/2-oxohepta-3-ene-1,7-dioic acid hydratase in catechol pathway